MSYDLIGYYPEDDAVAGDESDDFGIAGDLEIIGYDDEYEDALAGGLFDEELEAIAGLEEDLDVLAGYSGESEVARLLEATAGLAPRRRAPARRAPARASAPRVAAARRVARRVSGLGRQLQRERARTAQAVTALRRTRAATAARPGGAPAIAGGTRLVPAAGGGQRALVPREPSQTGVEPIGINSESVIPAGQTRQITVRPQVLFRPTKYHVSEAVGQNFLINNITVGKNSQFGTSGALPGTTFSDENLRFAWRTCQPGQDITVTVTNITSADHPYLSTMWGDSAE